MSVSLVALFAASVACDVAGQLAFSGGATPFRPSAPAPGASP